MRHRHLWPWVAMVVPLAAMCVAVWTGNRSGQPDATRLQQQVMAIASQLHAPGDFNTMTAAQSTLPVAEHMRYEIQEALLKGKSRSEILSAMVAEYGQDVLAAPSSKGFGAALWWLPAGLAVLGVVMVAAVVRRRRASGSIDSAAEEPDGGTVVDDQRAERDIRARLSEYL